MNHQTNPDVLHRGVKMAMDTGEAATLDEAYSLFGEYQMAIQVGMVIGSSRAHQAALLTLVNAGRRSLLGGVHVLGLGDVPLLVELPGGYRSLGQAVTALGGTLAEEVEASVPLVMLGATNAGQRSGLSLRLTFGGWRGGVGPGDEIEVLSEGQNDVMAATLAAALAVGEIFQNLRGNVLAGRRTVGLSLWRPDLDWCLLDEGPDEFVVPAKLWLVGLGHLGQAYLWALAMLPVAQPEELELTLQDFDKLTASNDSTSVLTDTGLVGKLKTREMARWLEDRGFRATIVERRFDGIMAVGKDDPRIALFGVDNSEARAHIDSAGFDLVVEAGLGAGPQEYLAMRIHTFPASVTSQQKWGGEIDEKEGQTSAAAYADLLQNGEVDECGLVQLATRTVGAPFVGLVAACLVLSEVIRRLNGGVGVEVMDLSLRAPNLREVVEAETRKAWNPGYIKLADSL